MSISIYKHGYVKILSSKLNSPVMIRFPTKTYPMLPFLISIKHWRSARSERCESSPVRAVPLVTALCLKMGWVKQVNLAILWHHDKHDKRMTYQWISSYVMSCLLPAWLAGILLFLPLVDPEKSNLFDFRLTKVCWAPCLEMPKSWVKILGPGNIGIWGHSNGAAYLDRSFIWHKPISGTILTRSY